MKINKKYLWFFSLLIFIIIWISLLSYFWPKEIVDFIWVQNTYLAILIIASIWGFSSLTWFSLLTIMATFVSWWSNPALIWLFAWSGVMVWDSFVYYFWTKWRQIITWKSKKYIEKISKKIKYTNKYLTYIFIYIYVWILPLSDDILLIALAIIKYPYKKIFIPLILWNITHMMIYSYLFYYWIDFFI